MRKTIAQIILLSLLLLLPGCRGSSPEIEIPTETVTEPEATQEESTAATEKAPTYQNMQTYQWMVNLKAEDVAFIEFVCLSDINTPYRRYEGEEIQEVIDLFQSPMCLDYASSEAWQGYFTQEFHVIMKDGTAHTVCSIGTITTVIDGAAFDTISAWIMNWPETGNAPLPTDWEQQTASRNYITVEEEKSFLVTNPYDDQRAYLDYRYDSEIKFGADSRNYPIGRGVVQLYAQHPSATGVQMKAYWSGSYGGRQVLSKPECWLERWDENTPEGEPGYHAIETDAQLIGPTIILAPQEDILWSLDWETVYGSLEPGYYRIGMTFVEQLNGMEQNETVCYAKFCIES